MLWSEMSGSQRAAYLYASEVREQKKKETRECCLCPRRLKQGQLYMQHGGHLDRIAHVDCVNLLYVPGTVKRSPARPGRRSKRSKHYSEQEFQKAAIKAWYAGFIFCQAEVFGQKTHTKSAKTAAKQAFNDAQFDPASLLTA